MLPLLNPSHSILLAALDWDLFTMNPLLGPLPPWGAETLTVVRVSFNKAVLVIPWSNTVTSKYSSVVPLLKYLPDWIYIET